MSHFFNFFQLLLGFFGDCWLALGPLYLMLDKLHEATSTHSGSFELLELVEPISEGGKRFFLNLFFAVFGFISFRFFKFFVVLGNQFVVSEVEFHF